MQFSSQTVFVTGASRGIGKAVATHFAALGAAVILHFFTRGKEARLLAEQLPGGPHAAVGADLACPEQLPGMVEEALHLTGRIDILVNNAGIYEEHRVPGSDFSGWKRTWDRTIAVNLNSPAYLCHLVAQHMIRQGGGKIVNITSRGAYRGEPDHPAYGASKAGLGALSQSLAQALAPYHIQVYALAPGWVDTDMSSPGLSGPGRENILKQSPMYRVAQPHEIATATAMLVSPGMEYATGCVLDMNGASYLR